MSSELGAWLRQQREDRGWTRSELARQLIKIARTRGDTSVPSADNISHNIYRWERGAVTPAERYQLYYCGAFGIPFSQFGAAARPGGTGAAGRAAGAQPGTQPGAPALSGAPPGMVDPSPGAAAALAYRELPSAGPAAPAAGASAIRREVLMAAHEGSEHAERAEQRGIGEATLEQFRADVAQLSAQYLTGEPFPLFTEMRRVRNRVAEALERRQWPRDAAELYLLAGCLSALMAAAATNLGYPQAAGELARAGWAYATIIDHRPLMARLRLCAAYAVYWNGHPEQTADLARSGLEYLADGQNAAQLHLLAGLAQRPPGRRRRARGRRSRPRATPGTATTTTSCSRSAASSASPGPRRPTTPASSWRRRGLRHGGEAAAELEDATGLYAAGPGPGEQHSRRCRMLAHTDLAVARLRAGALDAAAAALEPVLALPPGERTAVQSQRLSVIRAELGPPGLPRLGPGPPARRAGGRVRPR